jgi:hypothetical protein
MELPFEMPAGVELITDIALTSLIQPRMQPPDTWVSASARSSRRGSTLTRGSSILLARGTRTNLVAGRSLRIETDALCIPRCSSSTSSARWTSPPSRVSNHRCREFCLVITFERLSSSSERSPPPRPEARDPSLARGRALRSYFVFCGAIESATELEFNGWSQAPNLWWPDDRSWCVATEVDGYSTYVGGSAGCVEAIQDDQRLEALPSSTSFQFDLWSERVDPRPPGMRSVSKGLTVCSAIPSGTAAAPAAERQV